jgi:hypothetical protein
MVDGFDHFVQECFVCEAGESGYAAELACPLFFGQMYEKEECGLIKVVMSKCDTSLFYFRNIDIRL